MWNFFNLRLKTVSITKSVTNLIRWPIRIAYSIFLIAIARLEINLETSLRAVKFKSLVLRLRLVFIGASVSLVVKIPLYTLILLNENQTNKLDMRRRFFISGCCTRSISQCHLITLRYASRYVKFHVICKHTYISDCTTSGNFPGHKNQAN